MNEAQVTLLIQLIEDIAQAVVNDSTSHGSDYRGMALWRIRENAEKFAQEFKAAEQPE